jgi:hypothetical protein
MPADGIAAASTQLGLRHVPLAALPQSYITFASTGKELQHRGLTKPTTDIAPCCALAASGHAAAAPTEKRGGNQRLAL